MRNDAYAVIRIQYDAEAATVALQNRQGSFCGAISLMFQEKNAARKEGKRWHHIRPWILFEAFIPLKNEETEEGK